MTWKFLKFGILNYAKEKGHEEQGAIRLLLPPVFSLLLSLCTYNNSSVHTRCAGNIFNFASKLPLPPFSSSPVAPPSPTHPNLVMATHVLTLLCLWERPSSALKETRYYVPA